MFMKKLIIVLMIILAIVIVGCNTQSTIENCNQYEGVDNSKCVNAVADESKSLSPDERVVICESHKVEELIGRCVIDVVVNIVGESSETKEKSLEYCADIKEDIVKDECYSHVVRLTGETTLEICNLMTLEPKKLDCISKVAKNSGDSAVCDLLEDGDRFHACRSGIDPNYVKEISAKDCKDADGGKDYFARGEVWGHSEIDNSKVLPVSDSCVSSTELKEYYCDEQFVREEEVTCPEGYSCKSGFCYETYLDSVECSDSDNGKNYFEKGSTKGSSGFMLVKGASGDSMIAQQIYLDVEDKCDSSLGENHFLEYYCENGAVKEEHRICQEGTTCVDGACVE